MRHLALLTLAAAASAQVNTEVTGLVLTNRVTTLTDTSSIYSSANTSTGIGYITDDDTSTFLINLGQTSSGNGPGVGSLQGSFAGPISASASGLYLISLANAHPGNFYTKTVYSGTFSVQLDLGGTLTSVRNYAAADFTVTDQVIPTIAYYAYYVSGGLGTVTSSPTGEMLYVAYLYVPFADFGASSGQVNGVKLSNFTYSYLDLSYIGAGYAGTPVPEASNYGLALGGLALVGAVIRRRRKVA